MDKPSLLSFSSALAAHFPPGATPCADASGQCGTAFVVWAPSAHGVELELCDPTGVPERRVPLEPAPNGLWAYWLAGVGTGQLYGLRARGPWAPEQGQRFNPAKLLLDPFATAVVDPSGQAWARQALRLGHTSADPLHPSQPWHAHQPCPLDDAHERLRSLVLPAAALTPHPLTSTACAPPPWRVPEERVVLYEAHVKALTRLHPAVPPEQRGTYVGLAHPAVLAHLQRLGVTTVCLLPVHAHITERHLLARGLANHWGYNPLNVFMPHPGYAACTGGQPPRTLAEAQALHGEFRAMVEALHQAGLEVVLDVVFNHTCESDPDGPTLSWRGLGEADWYALAPHGAPHNFSGCGNSLNVTHPRVIQWVLHSLRWWVQVHGVDGFRFDLGVSLGRDARHGHAYTPLHPLLSAMAQDPVLAGVRRIAEPWDIGPHGHQTGHFPPGWAEWNDGFRDTVRAYWLGHPCTRGALAHALTASASRFAAARAGVCHAGQRSPCASINLLTAHDGFTLHDLTAYAHKHNHANGEDNRDGHSHNLSHNLGTEGPSTDPAICQRRAELQRALLATLFCAQGTPQLLAGDELGHSQHGNNNAYCQDNPTTWLAWPAGADPAPGPAHPFDHRAFVSDLCALRRALPALRHPRWFTGQPPAAGEQTEPDIVWLDVDGQPLSPAAWDSPHHRTLVACLAVGEGGAPARERVLLIWHSLNHPLDHATVHVRLPPGPWHWRLNSARAQVWPQDNGPQVAPPLVLHEPTVAVLAQSLLAPTP